MRRYLLGYLAAYTVSLAAFIGMLLIAIGNWLFTDSPLWFNALFAIVTALPFLALGEVFGRRPAKKPLEKPIKGLTALLVVMGVLAPVGAVLGETYTLAQILTWPATLMSGVFLEMIGYGGYWEGLFVLLGHLLLPLLYHLGWRWGRFS